MDTSLSLKDWLQLPCLPDEVKGDANTGFYLGIEKIREKIKFMENEFHITVNYGNFRHFLFNRMDKEVFASGSLEVELVEDSNYGLVFYKKLVGAYSFNIQDYDNHNDRNEQYAGTLKSLCIGNALGNEYPQFGSLLNTQDLTRTIQRKASFKTSSKITDFQKGL